MLLYVHGEMLNEHNLITQLFYHEEFYSIWFNVCLFVFGLEAPVPVLGLRGGGSNSINSYFFFEGGGTFKM